MDRELAQLQKEVIKRLIEYEDELQAVGDANQLKKTKRVSSSVAINIAAFPDLIQSLLDSGVETKEITRNLRNFQESLLRDTVVIKGTETGHHGSMLRTGGSFYRADPKVWQGAVGRLADFFGTQFGDVPENIRSYINYAHKSDTNTKGIEAAVLGKVANPDPLLTAHPFGTVARQLTKDLSPEELSDPDKFFNEMAKRIDVQLEAAKRADIVSRPLQEAVQQNIDPRAYKTSDIKTNLEIQKKVLLPENLKIIEQGILDVVNGAAKLKFKANLLGVLPVVGTALGAATVESAAQAREEEIKQRPNDPTLKVNKALDIAAGYGDRLSLAGMATSATGIGAVVGAPMVAIGEGLSLAAGAGSISLDFGRFMVDELKRGPKQIRGRSGAKRAMEEDKVLN